MYIYQRGEGMKRRVMHLAEYDRRGEMTGRSLCGREGFNTSCNLPLGQPVCKECSKEDRNP